MKSFLKFGLLLQLGLVLGICLLWGDAIPLYGQSALYAVSLTLRNILFFCLPFIIFSYLFRCILSFQKGAFLLVGFLIFWICCSNFICTLVAYGVGVTILPHMPQIDLHSWAVSDSLLPLWELRLPALIPNEGALFSGLILGSIFAFYPNPRVEKVSHFLKKIADTFLLKIFMKLMPLFIAGFVVKMQHDGVLSLIIDSYGKIFFIIFVTQMSYILFLYGLGARFQKEKWVRFFKNALPAGLTGFSTMSSAAALPLNIKSAEQNTQNPSLAQAVTPTTVSIHLVGDSLGIPIMALAILQTFGIPFPSFMEYLGFAFFFVLAKFAVAAVPGGGILVMVPILEKYLGFSPSMSVLITAVYILFDPVVTGANVLGNGAFSILFCQFFEKATKKLKDSLALPLKKGHPLL